MRRVSVLVGLSVVLVTALWWVFLVSPRNARIDDLNQQTSAALDTEQRLRVQVRQLQEIRDREVEYIAAVGKLDALIPDRPLLEEFIEQIYALAGDTGVDLQTLSPSIPAPTTEGSELREIAISVQIEGEFFEILGFLFGLNDMERLVRVDGIALASSSDESGNTVLSVSLELRLFTLADLLPLEGLFPDPADPDEGDPPEETTTTTTEAPPEAAGAGGGS